MSLNTIRKHLQENKVKYSSTLKKPLLSEKLIEKRFQWANENINRDWGNLVFTDESSFWIFIPLKRAWTTKGTRFVQRTVKHPAKVHVYGCFSAQGFGRLVCFTENLNAKRMLRLYKFGLLKSAEKLYG